MSQELQGKLTEAGASLQEKQAKLEMLRQRLAKEAVTLEATAAQVWHKLLLQCRKEPDSYVCPGHSMLVDCFQEHSHPLVLVCV